MTPGLLYSLCVIWMQGCVKCVDCYFCVGRDAEHLPGCAVPSQCLCYFVPMPDAQMRPFRGQAEQVLRLFLWRYIYGNTNEPSARAVFRRYAAPRRGDPLQSTIR